MRLIEDRSWSRRGVSLLWGAAALSEIAIPAEVVSIRGFFGLGENWPEELPSGGGHALVVAGVEGCVDVLPPEDAQRWLAEELRPRVLSFQGEYESQASLILWLPSGRSRVRMRRATDSYHWHCAPPWANHTIPLGQILWSGAESDVGRILDPHERSQDADGPAWAGLHHPRIS